jgi:hypothetical protein
MEEYVKQLDDLTFKFFDKYMESTQDITISIDHISHSSQLRGIIDNLTQVQTTHQRDMVFKQTDAHLFESSSIIYFVQMLQKIESISKSNQHIVISFGTRGSRYPPQNIVSEEQTTLFLYDSGGNVRSRNDDLFVIVPYKSTLLLPMTTLSTFLVHCRNKLRDVLIKVLPRCDYIYIWDKTNRGVHPSLTWLKSQIPDQKLRIGYTMNLIPNVSSLVAFCQPYNQDKMIEWTKYVSTQNFNYMHDMNWQDIYTDLPATIEFNPFLIRNFDEHRDLYLSQYLKSECPPFHCADLYVPFSFTPDQHMASLQAQISGFNQNTQVDEPLLLACKQRILKIQMVDQPYLSMVKMCAKVGPDGLRHILNDLIQKTKGEFMIERNNKYVSAYNETQQSSEDKTRRLRTLIRNLFSVLQSVNSMWELDKNARKSNFNQSLLVMSLSPADASIKHIKYYEMPKMTQDQAYFLQPYYLRGAFLFSSMYVETQTLMVNQQYNLISENIYSIYAQAVMPCVRVRVVHSWPEQEIVVVEIDLLNGPLVVHPMTPNVLNYNGQIVLLRTTFDGTQLSQPENYNFSERIDLLKTSLIQGWDSVF